MITLKNRFAIPRRTVHQGMWAMTGLISILVGCGISTAAAQQGDAGQALPTCFAKPASADAPSATGDYRLATGDQVQVLVYQREDLSGTHYVADDGKISIPLLGRLPAAGSTLQVLEKTVAKTIAEATGRTEHVSIELPTRRPIYVVGLVNNPGSYPYSADLTVLHAVALGGGLYRPDERAGGLVNVSRESARLGQSTLQLTQVLARRTRLLTEREAKDAMEPPQRLVALQGEAGAKAHMARQLQIMKKRNEAFEQQLVSLKKTATLAKQEIENLKEQEKLIIDQTKLARQELKATNKLKQKGLVRRSDLFTIQRVIANLEADRRDVAARVSRAQRNLLETEGRSQLLGINHKLTIDQELDQAEIDIATNEYAIRSSQWIVGELKTAARQDEDEKKSTTIAYEVVRTIDKVRNAFAAKELTALCPGDIIRVHPARIN